MLKVGDRLPEAQLFEFMDVASEACSLGPNAVNTAAAAQGKTIALFALPGAFTPACSAQHLPGYIQAFEEFKAAGVDEIWCLSVNDAFVMGAWGREQGAAGKVRLLADGSADFARAADLVLDLTAKGLGVRSQRYSALVVDGVVRSLNLEGGGGYAVSDAATLLAQARAL
jgi:peroxiredoxin